MSDAFLNATPAGRAALIDSRLRATMATLGYGEAEVAAREREVFLKRVRPHVEAYLREDVYLARPCLTRTRC